MIETADGLMLSGVWSEAVDPVGVVVFCHPHPLDGGTMNSPLMRGVTHALVDAGLHVLRFDFRGVGASQGSWGAGTGEVLDVAAAVTTATMTHPDLPLGIAGWSFGATTSLRWQSETGSTLPWVGIAPGIRSYRGTMPPDPRGLVAARRLIVIGDRDQFASVAAMQEFADAAGARLEVLAGSDHFFVFRDRTVGAFAADHFGGRPISVVGGSPGSVPR